MIAYYNENDPKAAATLRELIKAGAIAFGYVDERSILDVRPSDLEGFTQCHFLAGIGAWSHALRLADWTDDRPVWTGSCPCQPFSTGGTGLGFADERHLWPAWHHLIEQSRPNTIFGEQVASPKGLGWLDVVHADLEESGYASGATVLCAAGNGAPHGRHRLYFVADTHIERQQGQYALLQRGQQAKAGFEVARCGQGASFWTTAQWSTGADGKTRLLEPGTEPVVDGASANLDALHQFGNAIVPQVAASFISAYREAIE